MRGAQLHRSGRASVAGLFVLTLALALATTLTPAMATAPTTVQVKISNYSFIPSKITVVIGVNNTVSWTNADMITHTVTGDSGSWGGTLPSGATYTYTFTAPGTYGYHCSIHTFMTGTVTVLAAGSTSASSSSSASSSTSATTTSSAAPSTSSSSSTTAPSTTTTSTTTTSHSSASSPSTSSSTSSQSSATQGVPEFPYAQVAIVALTAVVLASYFLVRQRPRGLYSKGV